MEPRSYEAACHAMQTGVAHDLERDATSGTPKHLRVGVNVAMCDLAALAKVLVRKGVITYAEYVEAMRETMEEEVARYEKMLAARYGATIHLH